jgi:CRP/FNR family transcriptional regulator, anaerobic regulatory protein
MTVRHLFENVIPIRAESAWRGTSDCRNCGIRDMVLFADLDERDFNLIHAPIDNFEFRTGQRLYDEGEPVQGIFTLRSGMIKLVRTAQDGRMRIVRVLRTGDIAGLEALATDRYESEAMALTDVQLCRIPLTVVQTLGAQSPRLHRRLMEKWQRALRDADDWLAELNFGTARQRVAHLILKMRSSGDPELTTLFSREDMGAMLDLKFETVSREINGFVREGLLEPLDKSGRRYRVLSAAALGAA